MSTASAKTAPSAPVRSPSDGAGGAGTLSPRHVLAFVVMCFGMFMAILDIQIVSASLTEIQAGLSASGDEIPWVQTAYLVAASPPSDPAAPPPSFRPLRSAPPPRPS